MEFTTLSNGIKAPLLGVGTFLLSLEETEKSVYEAIRLGYRMIDTANGYLNETAVGKAVARAIRPCQTRGPLHLDEALADGVREGHIC